ncbi:ribose-phosphate pyrophosphokinase 1 [Hibiscus syriacus]|uniref:Ribose-phosphate pyrophosphokinase 1 n=1 Tax=Hibiscus syriacus TaxID=106335 RepID=A0A6A2WFB5_HIBSY|nr:ribose-phosphate pyrophosphokinase 1 [Hibiscus syriacus]
METKVMSRGFGVSLPVDNVQALAPSIQEPGENPTEIYQTRDEVIDKMKTYTKEFFNLPLEEKIACAQNPNHKEGYGQAFVFSEDQKLDWNDMLYLSPPACFLKKHEILADQSPLIQVMIQLMKFIANNLGTDPEKLASFFQDLTQGIRINYYPPCLEASRVFDASPHSDATSLTLLLQVNQVEGLQIKRNDKWIPVKPIPGALITNIGDMMEVNRTMPLEEFFRLRFSRKVNGKLLLNQMKL